ncbi:hypothetical protein WJX74_008822 [Apatococcus lobatus]|uniref:Uncharacterized protein n=1 Tax=Apatococcus lobatus TaxID=904363 RepID=A0AAW1RLD9_9CHLO
MHGGDGTVLCRLEAHPGLPTPSTSSAALLRLNSGLITGGTGALGSLVARWLILCHPPDKPLGPPLARQAHRGSNTPDQQPAASSDEQYKTVWATSSGMSVNLLGRSGRADAVMQLLSSTGLVQSLIDIRQCNASCREDMTAALQQCCQGAGHAIFHAAGSLSDAVVAKQTATSVRQVFAAKVTSAEVMLEKTGLLPVSSLQLFSSVSATVGNPGQANYAAANGVLDAAAGQLQDCGVAAHSIGWGAWGGGGMAASLLPKLMRQGLGAVDPAQGLSFLAALLAGSSSLTVQCSSFLSSHYVYSPFILDRLIATRGHSPSFYSNLSAPQSQKPRQLDPDTLDVSAAGQQEVAFGSSPPVTNMQQQVDLIGSLSRIVRGILGQNVPPLQPLMEAGLDSLGAIELRNAVAATFHVSLPVTAAFDYPTIQTLAQQISKLVTVPTSVAANPNVSKHGEIVQARMPFGRARRQIQPQGVQLKQPDAISLAGQDTANILAIIARIVRQVLGASIELQQPLMEAGLESLGAIELRTAIQQETGVNLPATFAFDHPNIASMAVFLAAEAHFPSLRLFQSLAERPPVPQQQDLLPKLQGMVQDILGSSVAANQPLMEAGLDSLAAIELRNAIASHFSITLPATAVFDHPTLAALASLISGMLAASARQSPDASQPVISQPLLDVQDYLGPHQVVEVLQASCMYSGCNPDGGHAAFWSTIAHGTNIQQVVPLERWDIDAFYNPEGPAGSQYMRFGAFIQAPGLHDVAVSKLSRNEAIATDPQARLLIEASGEVLLSQNGGSGALPRWQGTCGTYVGCMFVDYMSLLRNGYGFASTGPVMTGNGAPYQCGRVAYTFGLQGPCQGIDTACSSSLVAAHNAFRGILGQEETHALAAGINLMLWHDVTSGICQLQALSRVGRCQTFEAAADGYGRGEGIAVLLLGSVDVRQDTDQGSTMAILRGSAVNQDGRSSSLTAPNGPSQKALVGIALEYAESSKEEVGYVAIHGTGTPLGDPIEVGALAGALANSQSPLCLGSVKACYGHTEGAAGVTGALLAIAAAAHCQQAPIVNLRSMNPYVSSALEAWGAGASCAPAAARATAPAAACNGQMSGTSSFGMSGVNAHVLVSAPDWCAVQTSAAQPLPLAKSHFWAGPFQHILVHPATQQHALQFRFNAQISSASLAFLRDHQVLGRALLPGSAFLEAAWAAGAVLTNDAVSSHMLSVLQSVSIEATFALPSSQTAQQPAHVSSRSTSRPPQQLTVVINTATWTSDAARVSISSSGGSSQTSTQHVTAAFTQGNGTASRPAQARPATSMVTAACCSISIILDGTPMEAPQNRALAATAHPPEGPNSGFYTHPASVDVSLHLSAIRPLAAIPQRPEVPVGLAGFSGPSGHSAACPGVASADLAISSQPLTWQAALAGSTPTTESVAGGGPRVMLHGLQTKPMGGQRIQAHSVAQEALSYSVAWQLAEPHSLTGPSTGPNLYPVDPINLPSRHTPIQAAAAMLQHLQHSLLPDPTHPMVLQLPCLLSGISSASSAGTATLRSVMVAAAAMAALARVASSEASGRVLTLATAPNLPANQSQRPQLYFPSQGLGTSNEIRLPAPLAQPSIGMHGAGLSEGGLFLPQVLHNSEPQGSFEMASPALAIHGGQSGSIAFSDNQIHDVQHSTVRHALITGGLGALGQLLAVWLCRNRASDGLSLAGRSGRASLEAREGSPGYLPMWAHCLGHQGDDYPAVHMVRCDAASKEESTAGLRSQGLWTDAPAVDSVFHAGGVLQDAMLGQQSFKGLREIFAPKLDALSAITAQGAAAGVQTMVLFSSIASLLGSPGQGNYAAANAAMDAAADHTQSQGNQMVSIQWGAWASVGMAASNATLLSRLRRQGYGAVAPSAGLLLLQGILGHLARPQDAGITVIAASPFQWDAFLSGDRKVKAGSFYDQVAPAAVPGKTGLPPASMLHAETEAAHHELQLDDILSQLSGIAASVLEADVEPTQPLMEAGLDSLAAVELRNAIASAFSITLPATLAFDFPTTAAIAQHIVDNAASADIAAEATTQEASADDLFDEEALDHYTINGNAVMRGESGSIVTNLLRTTTQNLQSIVADIAGQLVEDDQPMAEAGLDSLGSVELRSQVSERFGIALPVTLAYDYPTVQALAGFITPQLAAVSSLGRTSSATTLKPQRSLARALTRPQTASIVVQGVASQFPNAEIGGLQTFWSTASAGKDLPGQPSLQRWDVDALFSPDLNAASSVYTRFGSYLNCVESFDAACFKLSPAEAIPLDPHARLLLENTQELLMSPTHDAQSATSQAGVYIGCMWAHEFVEVLPQLGLSATAANSSTGNTFSFLVGRLSYTFGLTGPCISTDTACSSSLVAAHLASKGIKDGETDTAVAGGVNVMLSPKTAVKICRLQALSPAGRCKTFDVSADGYGRGEGVGLMLLSSDSGQQSQQHLAVIQSAGLVPGSITCLAVHGTGTPLGDPIETGAIGRALGSKARPGTDHVQRLALTSVKSCYGHTEGAAGIAGAQMALATLSSRARAPILNLRSVNSYVAGSWEEWSGQMNLQNSASRQHMPGPISFDLGRPMAGTSSFGMSGINCHMVMGQTADSADPASSPDLWKIPSWGTDPLTPPRASSGGLAHQGSSLLGPQRGASRILPKAGHSSLGSLKGAGSELDRLLRIKSGSGTMHHGQSDVSRMAGGEQDRRLGGTKIIRGKRRWWGLPPISRLLTCFSTAAAGVAKFACNLGEASVAYLQDHRVQERALMPATAFFELAQSACQALVEPGLSRSLTLGDLSILAPCFLADLGSTAERRNQKYLLECSVVIGDGTPELTISSPSLTAVHLKGSTALLAASTPREASPQRNPIDQRPGPPSMSAMLHSHLVVALRKGMVSPAVSAPTRIAATVHPMDPSSGRSSSCRVPIDYYTHPAAADATLHLGAVPIGPAKGASRVPVALEGLMGIPQEGFGAGGAAGWAAAAVPAAAADAAMLMSDALWHCEGPARIVVSGLAAKLLPGQGSKRVGATGKDASVQEDLLYEAQLQAAALCQCPANPPSSHAMANRRPAKAGRLSIFTSSGQQLVTQSGRPSKWLVSAQPMSSRKRSAASPGALKTLQDILAHLPKSVASTDSTSASALTPQADNWKLTLGQAVMGRTDSEDSLGIGSSDPAVIVGAAALELLQAIAQNSREVSGVTASLARAILTGSQLIAQCSSAAEDIVRGLMRVAALELPAVKWDVVDMAANTITKPPNLLQNSCGCLGYAKKEGYDMESRLLRAASGYLPKDICLVPEPRGAFSNLRPYAVPDVKLGAEQIQIQPLAVGLNFRDVLNCLGMYPGDPGNPGADCAGIVQAVGSAVRNLHKVGDYVYGQAEGCLGTSVIGSAHTMVPCPAVLGPVEASTIPTVFMTAWTCLREAPHLKPGQSILIHAATGGLGLAAVQVAMASGCLPLGTAGSSQKRSHLRSMGAAVALSSRSTEFPDQLIATGKPAPVMVLNSLTSPGMVAASLASVAAGGQFVEVGKRDIWSPARISQERPDLHSHLVAIDFWPSKTVGDHMRQLSILFRQGNLKPLPPLTHPLSNSAAALRQLSAARHVGKVVVQHPSGSNAGSLAHVGRKGRWVVTGGLGALGSLSGRWLAQRGMQHLCLLGRTGHMPLQQGPILTAMTGGDWNAAVTVRLADSACAEEMASVLGSHRELGPELQGVLHAGGVVRDAIIQKQTAAGMREVLGPKAQGSSLIRNGCGHAPVTALKLFSSVAARLGSGGQANYAAANAVMDSMAASLQMQGVPGLAVNWGAWAGAGMAAASGIERLARLGFGAIQPGNGMAAMGALLRSLQGTSPTVAQVIGSAFFWDRLQVSSPFYQEFREVAVPEPGFPARSAPASKAQAAPTHKDLEAQIAKAVASVIGSAVDLDQPLVAAGLDSLGAVELRNEIGRAVGSELPGTLVYDYPTISSIVAFLLPKMMPAAQGPDFSLQVSQSLRSVPLLLAEQASLDTMVEVEAVVAQTATKPQDLAPAGDAMKVVPLDRWDVDDHPEHQLGRFGGFIASWAEFDPAVFGIAPTEAALMDPSQRLLLQDTWDILEADTGLQQTAVAVGIARLSDPPAVTGRKAGGGFTGTGRALSVTAGRLSYTHGLRGPCVSIDTACSSSLVGTHFVHTAMLHSGCSAGLSCGVNVPMNWETTAMFVGAAMLAPDGRCKTLDASADGYVRSEACVAIKLRTAFSHGGMQPSDAALLEMHGTGTALGDPIEIGAALAVLGPHVPGRNVRLAAAKSKLGHAETGAGAVGIAQTMLQMQQHRQLPMTHLRMLNPYVLNALEAEAKHLSNAQAGVSIQRQHAPMQLLPEEGSGSGISAFAFQGTNAHIVLAPSSVKTLTSIGSEPGTSRQAAIWQHGRYWYLPAPHSLLACFSWHGEQPHQARWDLQLRQPSQTFLWDHQVSGRILFPAAAMFEATRSAGGYLLDGIHTPSVSLTLLNAAIPAAFELPSLRQQRQPAVQPPPAQVIVDISGAFTGNAVLQTTTTTNGDATSHLRATMGRCQSYSRNRANVLSKFQEATKDPAAAGNVGGPLQVLQQILQICPEDPSYPLGHGRPGGRGQAACPMAYASPPQDAAEGFSIHPAAADSCMHVGALCGNPDGRIRVPGALGAFLAEPLGSPGAPHSQASQASGPRGDANGNGFTERWAVGEGEPEQTDETRRLSYSITAHGGSPGVVIAGLEAKVLRLGASGPSAAATTASTDQSQYCSEWRTIQPSPASGQGSSAMDKPHVWSWRLSKTGSLQGPRVKIAPSPNDWRAAVQAIQHAGQTALRLMQSLPDDTGDIALHHKLSQDGVCSAPANSNNLSGSCLTAMIKVAAAEKPGHAWRICAADPLNAAAMALQPLDTASLYDAAFSTAGSIQQPFLRECTAQPGIGKPGYSNSWAITGGLGALGLVMAHWACQQAPAASISLLSRSGHAEGQPALASLLSPDSHGHVEICKADISCQADAGLSTGGWSQLLSPNVLHAGGVLADGLISKQTPAKLRAVLAPKVNGALNLHHQAACLPLAGLVLFSSVATLLGNAGQSNYAAANGCLDAFATNLTAQGQACSSIQWGAWGGSGMAAEDASLAARLERSGLRLLPPAAGLQALGLLLKPIQMASAFFTDVAITQAPPAELHQQEPTVTLHHAHQGLSIAEVTATLTSTVEGVIGTAIEPNTPMMSAGLDSLAAVELRNMVQQRYSVALSATAAFDYPSIQVLAEHIAGQVKPVRAPTSATRQRQRPGMRNVNPGPTDVKDHAEVLAELAFIIRSVLGADIAPDQPLMQAGLDSLGAVELRSAMSQAFNVQLPATVAFDYPTPAALADHIASRLPTPSQEQLVGPILQGGVQHISQPIPASPTSSIVSLACRYPAASLEAAGNVTGQQGFWGNLARGQNLQTPVPLSRWDVDGWYAPNLEPHRMYVPFGSFVDCVDAFDASLFGLAAGEALALDPQARILLEQTQEALMQANLGKATGATGVYIGCMYTEYLDSILGPQGLADSNSSSIIGHGLSFLVGRVSFTFGLAGPCISTDTACSSSLVALHLANQGLMAGQTEAAMAGGVNIMLEPRTTARICLLQALSPVGRCKTFDATGDGYGRGEGFAVAVLRSLQEDATTEDAPTAIVRGSAVNQDGRSSSLTAPNGPSQLALVAACLREAELDASAVALVAVHGTGTPLGDPIEVGALAGVLKTRQGAPQQVTLSSNKACYGHTEGTAGITGALLALTSLQQQTHTPILNLRNLNPYVEAAFGDWASHGGVPATAPRQLMPGTDLSTHDSAQEDMSHQQPAAGTSSFGMSGVNAHMIMSPDTSSAHARRMQDGGTRKQFPGTAFQRKRFWGAPRAHAMLAHFMKQFGNGQADAVFQARLDAPRLAFLWDHGVMGRSLLAGAAMLEAALAAAGAIASADEAAASKAAISDASIMAPCILPKIGEGHINCHMSLRTAKLEVRSSSQLHLSGSTAQSKPSAPSSTSKQSPDKMPATVSNHASFLYHILGIQHADQRAAYALSTAAAAEFTAAAMGCKIGHLSMPRQELVGFMSHPAMADASIHLAAVPEIDRHPATHVPVGMGCVMEAPDAPPASCWSIANCSSPSSLSSTSSVMSIRMQRAEMSVGTSVPSVASAAGSAYIIQGLTTKPMTGGRPAASQDATQDADKITFDVQWQTSTPAPPEVHSPASRASSRNRHLLPCWAHGGLLLTSSQAADRSSRTDAGVGLEWPSCTRGGPSAAAACALHMQAVQTCMRLRNGSSASAQPGCGPILLGRSGRLSQGSTAPFIKAQHANGAAVELTACDIGFNEDARAACASHAAMTPSPTGFMHASGVLQDALLGNQTLSGIRAVFASKVSGARTLMGALAHRPLGLTTLFSSVAGLLGSAGQGNYAAANAILDSMVAESNLQGLVSSSVQWGAWGGVGMAAQDASLAKRWARVGMGSLTPLQGLQILHNIVAAPSSRAGSCTAAAVLYWDRLLTHGRESTAFYAEFTSNPSSPPSLTAQEPAASLLHPASMLESQSIPAEPPRPFWFYMPMAERQIWVQELIGRVVNQALGKEVAGSQPLMMAGLDSLGAVEVRKELADRTELDLPATLVFDYPSPSELAAFFLSLMPPPASTPIPATPLGPAPTASRNPAAVKRMSGTSAASSAEKVAAESANPLWRYMPAPQRISWAKDVVRDVVVKILAKDLDAAQPLMMAGLDSLGAVEVRRDLEQATGLELPPTLVFDYPSMKELVDFLLQQLPPPASLPAPAASSPATASASVSSGILEARSHIPAAAASSAAPAAAGPAWGPMNLGQRTMFFKQQALAAVAAIIEGPVALSAPLMSSGLDSLGAVELRRELSNISGQDLPATLVFDYPTIDSMAEYITSQLLPPPPQASVSSARSAQPSSAQQNAINQRSSAAAAWDLATTAKATSGAIMAPMDDQEDEPAQRVLRPIRQLPPVNSRAPALTKPGYYTVPPIKRLRRYSDQQLREVPHFVVGREDLGEVAFLYPVSLLDLNLDAIVDLERGKVQVYGLEDGPSLPKQGTGLNCPALLTFRKMVVKKKDAASVNNNSLRSNVSDSRRRRDPWVAATCSGIPAALGQPAMQDSRDQAMTTDPRWTQTE